MGCNSLIYNVSKPYGIEAISNALKIPIPEKGQICWSECQNRCVKPECPEMTMAECTAITPGYRWDDSPMNTPAYGINLTCKQFSMLSPEKQLQMTYGIGSNNNNNVVLPGEVCWSNACQKCVKPYVKPQPPPEQSDTKQNIYTQCMPNKKSCLYNQETGSQWTYKQYVSGPGGAFYPEVVVPNETCEAWSNFNNWNKYGLNKLVLPGEVCYNPCTDGCIAPINY